VGVVAVRFEKDNGSPVNRRAVKRRRRSRREHPVAIISGAAWLVVILAPLWYLVTTSFRNQASYLSSNPWIPSGLTLANYDAIVQAGFGRFMLNSVLVAAASIVVVCVSGLAASYAIVRRTSRLATVVMYLALGCLALPAVSVVVPLYFVTQHLGLYNTLWAVILPVSTFGVPVAVLVFCTFLRDIPAELFDAMAVDGAATWLVFRRLALPMSVPAIAIVAVYQCVQSWNNLLFPLILTQSPNERVLPLVMYEFVGQFSLNVPGVLAAVVLSSAPLVFVYAVARKQIMGGIVAGYGR
jgi:raffinose/stachyose/melibiose transport system permease protein